MGKKIIVSILAIAIIVTSFSTTNAATFEMTKEELQAAFDKFITDFGDSDEDSSVEVDENLTITVGDEIINISNGEKEYEIAYDFSDGCKFYLTATFTKNMTNEEFNEERDKLGNWIAPLIAIGIHKGVTTEDMAIYVVYSIFSNEEFGNGFSSSAVEITYFDEEGNEIEENVDGLSKANEYFSGMDSSFYDELYSLSYTKDSETEDSVTYKCTLTVNTDEDFSIATDSAAEFKESLEKAFIPNEEDIKTDKKLPATGINIGELNTYRTVLGVAVLLLVSMVVYEIYSKKNKSKKEEV